MAKKKKKQQNRRATRAQQGIQRGWYESNVKGVPSGFIKFRNPERKKLSNLV